MNIQNIENMYYQGKHKAIIIFKDISNANKVLRNDEIKNVLKYEFKLPEKYIKTIGIIRDIPQELSIEDIKGNLSVDKGVEILEVERIKKFNFENKIEENTNLIKLTFRSSYLPPKVRLYYAFIKTQFFIPKPLFCVNCLKYGHFKKYCKNPKKCRVCTELIEDKHECSNKSKCNLCDESHLTNFKDCKIKKKEIEIKKLMVKQKKSYTEARKFFYDDNKGNEPFIFRKENIPEMPLSKTHNNTQRYEIPKNNIDSKKYEEVIHVLKQKDTFIQLTAQIISNLYDVGNPAKIRTNKTSGYLP